MKIGRRSFRQTYKVLADSNSSFHKIWIQAVTKEIVHKKSSVNNGNQTQSEHTFCTIFANRIKSTKNRGNRIRTCDLTVQKITYLVDLQGGKWHPNQKPTKCIFNCDPRVRKENLYIRIYCNIQNPNLFEFLM